MKGGPVRGGGMEAVKGLVWGADSGQKKALDMLFQSRDKPTTAR